MQGLADLLVKNDEGELHARAPADVPSGQPLGSRPRKPSAPTVADVPLDAADAMVPRDDPSALVLPRRGLVIEGKRELTQYIGAGAFGSVYEARQLDLDRLEAIKFLHERWMTPEHSEIGVRFLAEARVMARLRGPHLVAVHDWGTLPGGLPFFVMERLQGETLRARLRQGTEISLPEFFALATQLLLGLCEVHEHEVIHRDVKPENIFLTAEGVKLLDFGLAKTSLAMTMTDAVMGTPLYMAPEIITGREQPDTRTDLYATSAVMYEMLTGHPPFRQLDTSRRELEQAIVHEVPAPLRTRREGIPVELEALVFRGLAKRQAERPSTARAMLDRLLDIRARLQEASSADTHLLVERSIDHASPTVEMEPVPEDAPGPDDEGRRPVASATRRWRGSATALTVMALVVLGLGWAMWPLRPELGDVSDGLLVVRSYWAAETARDAHASACAALGGDRALPADTVDSLSVRCAVLSQWHAAWPRLQEAGEGLGVEAVVLVTNEVIRIRVLDRGRTSPLLAQLPPLELPVGTGTMERFAPVLRALLRSGMPVNELPILDPVRDGFHGAVLAEALRQYYDQRDPGARGRLEVLARCTPDVRDGLASYYCDLAHLLRATDLPCDRAITPLRTLLDAVDQGGGTLAPTVRIELARCLARDGSEATRAEAERLAEAILVAGPPPCVAASLMSTVARIAANGGDRSGQLRASTTFNLVKLQQCSRPMVVRELGERAYVLATMKPPLWCEAARDAADAHELAPRDLDAVVNWAEAVSLCPRSTEPTRRAVVTELDPARFDSGAPRARVAFMRWVLTCTPADARAVLDAYNSVPMSKAAMPLGLLPGLELCDRSSPSAYEVLARPKAPDSAVRLVRGLGLDDAGSTG